MANRARDEKYAKIANELLANNEINDAGDRRAVLISLWVAQLKQC